MIASVENMEERAAVASAQANTLVTEVPPAHRATENTNWKTLDTEEMERLLYLGRMVSAVSHELSSRLTSVVGYADLLIMREPVEKDRRLVQKLQGYAQNLRGLVENLSGFSRRQERQPEACSFDKLVQQAMDVVSCEAKARGITVRRTGEESLPEVMVRPSDFRLGMFICLDAFVRLIALKAERGKLQEVLIHAENGSDGRLSIDFIGAEDNCKILTGLDEPSMPEMSYGVRLLTEQGGEVSWQRSAEHGWVLRLTVSGT